MPDMTTDAAHSPSKTGVSALSLGSDQQPIIQIAADGEGKLSVTEAARALAGARKPKEQQQQAEQRQQAQQAEQESTAAARSEAGTGAGDAASQEAETRGEIERADPGAQELPPIEPPRSWTKEDKELFTSLPRATQERIAERERSRESDFLRRQNEAAEKLKGLAAKEQTAEQAKQHYEAALPQLLVTLQQQQAGEFADIRTLADVERLAREDWPRYALWDVQQKKIAEVTRLLAAAQGRQAQERLQQFSEFAKREDDLFKEKVPDMADADKAAKLQNACLAVLKDLGFEAAELMQSWHGRKDLSLRDHRVQLLIRDATLWREAQQKAKAAAAKPVPPVQRPGVAPAKGAAQAARIQNLTQQLENAKGVNALRAAADLVKARRAAR
jgi:hypothetical protein